MSDETVVNHISKYHYGIHFQEKFNSSKHEEQDKVWDMVECEWKAYHQMRWYISRVWTNSFSSNECDSAPNFLVRRATIFRKRNRSSTTGTKPSPTATSSQTVTPPYTTAHRQRH